MEYKILFYGAVILFFIIAIITLIVSSKGGYTSIIPIRGAGIMAAKSKAKMYDKASDTVFISHKFTLALLFIFIVFEWEEDSDEGIEGDDDTKLLFDGD